MGNWLVKSELQLGHWLRSYNQLRTIIIGKMVSKVFLIQTIWYQTWKKTAIWWGHSFPICIAWACYGSCKIPTVTKVDFYEDCMNTCMRKGVYLVKDPKYMELRQGYRVGKIIGINWNIQDITRRIFFGNIQETSSNHTNKHASLSTSWDM